MARNQTLIKAPKQAGCTTGPTKMTLSQALPCAWPPPRRKSYWHGDAHARPSNTRRLQSGTTRDVAKATICAHANDTNILQVTIQITRSELSLSFPRRYGNFLRRGRLRDASGEHMLTPSPCYAFVKRCSRQSTRHQPDLK